MVILMAECSFDVFSTHAACEKTAAMAVQHGDAWRSGGSDGLGAFVATGTVQEIDVAAPTVKNQSRCIAARRMVTRVVLRVWLDAR